MLGASLGLCSLFAQDEPPAENPLAALKDELARVLEEAALPFTSEQDQAIVLMMEDRRNASEDLFGELLDFSQGPTQGQEADRIGSAIEWMRGEFLVRLEDYLTEPQLAAWSLYLETQNERTSGGPTQNDGQEQTQYVRIYANDFRADEDRYGFRRNRTEVIERGGAGAFHGTVQFLIKDESLNAGRRSYNQGVRIPTVKPPSQERQTSFNVSGPVVPDRLTMSFRGSQNEAENFSTIDATLADGSPFSREIIRPTTHRSFGTDGTYQLTENHSLGFDIDYAPYSQENQGVGGFTLPERAWTTEGHSWDLELKQFSRLSAQNIHEARVRVNSQHDETIPLTDAVQINVIDAFSSGGSQNRSENDGRTYEFGNLYSSLRENMTIRTGVDGTYRRNRAHSTANFDGTFTFSSLGDFNAGQPFQFRVARGEPDLVTDQLELSFFMQSDWRLTPALTLYAGIRYDWQSNLDDDDNLAPRVGFAYAIGQATVIRGGAGIFYWGVPIDLIEGQRRFDGTRQFEDVIDSPSYPDPFQSGSVRTSVPSIRVTDPTLSEPYIMTTSIGIERTFLTTLFLSASYDYEHWVGRLRYRDINAPYDRTAPGIRSCTPLTSIDDCVRPDPTRGNVLQLEATRASIDHTIRLNFRQRFSIFNLSANYTYQRKWTDGGPDATGSPPTDNYDIQSDWSRANRFPLHGATGTVNAQLPFGMFLTGRMSANSGIRYTITTGRDDNRDTRLLDRPPGVDRNSVIGPKFLRFDFNISKAFFFGPSTGGIGGTRTNLNVFANITNAFNNVNFNFPSGVMTSPNFGFPTSAQDPRLVELGVRFQF